MAPPSLCSGLGHAWQKNEATRDRAFCAEIPEAMPNAHVVEAIVYDVEESPFAEAWQVVCLTGLRRGKIKGQLYEIGDVARSQPPLWGTRIH